MANKCNNVLSVTVAALLVWLASATKKMTGPSVYVSTTSGVVRGMSIVSPLNVPLNQFLSIPYAQPPIGCLRFAKPEPIVRPLDGVIDGTKASHACMQTLPFSNGVLDMDEDCLYLNVWAPPSDGRGLKPVMFWIHGGGYVWGTKDEPTYCGASLASHDVVVVTINYRLGQFGFLYGDDRTAPGNVGLYDQLLALKWVRANIHAFGGDKNQLTIAGESCGSWSVSIWLTSPLATGLYNRAIMASGAYMWNKNRDLRDKGELLTAAKTLAAELFCTGDEWLDCLRGKDAKILQKLSFDPSLLLNAFVLTGTEILPYTENRALQIGAFNKDVDLLAGVMKDEGVVTSILLSAASLTLLTKSDFVKHVERMDTIFHNLNTSAIIDFYLNDVNVLSPKALRSAYYDFIGDLFLLCPTYLYAKNYALKSKVNNNVYFYEWTYAGFNLPYGTAALHTLDLYYAFGILPALPVSFQTDADFSRYIMRIYTDFVKYGKPQNNWPKMISSETNFVPQVKELNPNRMNHIFKDRFRLNCDGFWKNYYGV